MSRECRRCGMDLPQSADVSCWPILKVIMPHHSEPSCVFNDAQIRHFIDNGFIRIDQAFRRSLADDARSILWRDLGCDPDDPATWTKPVIRLCMYTQKPFVDAAKTPTCTEVHAKLIRWRRRRVLGFAQT